MSDEIAPSDSIVSAWRERRQAKDISLQTIAKQTNIPQKKLEALEDGQFDCLGNATFINGYIRAYAKALDEDPATYIADYKSLSKQNDGAFAPSADESKGSGLARGSHVESQSLPVYKRIKLLHVSVAAIFIWVFVVFVLGGRSQNDPTDIAQGAVNIELTPSAPAENLNPDEISAADLSPKDKSPTDEPVPVEFNDPLPLDNNVSVMSSDAVVQVTPVASPLVENDDTKPRSGIVEEDILVLSFSEDCWTEIRDIDDRVLVAELKRKGDNLQLFGNAPFNIMLGNARAVTLTINGEAVSTVPYGNRKTLRLRVE